MANSLRANHIFLPGWGFSARAGSFISASCIDLPTLTHDNQLETIIHYLDEKIPREATVIAWSLSGLFSILYAYHFPEKMNKFILIASTPKFHRCAEWPGIDNNITYDFLKNKFINLVQYPNKNWLIRKRLQEQQIPLCPHYLNLLTQLDVRRYLTEMISPMTFIHGDKDSIVPSETLVAIKKLNPRIRTRTLLNAGHALPFTHAEILVNEIKQA